VSFRILGLDPAPFTALYGLDEAELAARGVERHVADACPGYPDRIEIRDADPGESLLLLNHEYQPPGTPYHGRHAIFVREGARERYDRIDEVPPAMRRRTLSLRAFDARHHMLDAELVEGARAEPVIERFLSRQDVRYVHAHYALRGCYAGLIVRPGVDLAGVAPLPG
jgi:hypothetical protein